MRPAAGAEGYALQGAQFRAQAAAEGVPVHVVALREARARALAVPPADVAGRAWRDTPERVRMLLLMLATERPESAARMPWASFTADERTAIGAAARQLRADLHGAAWLR